MKEIYSHCKHCFTPRLELKPQCSRCKKHFSHIENVGRFRELVNMGKVVFKGDR